MYIYARVCLFGPCYSARVSATLPLVEEGKSKIYKRPVGRHTLLRPPPVEEKVHNAETPHTPFRGPAPPLAHPSASLAPPSLLHTHSLPVARTAPPPLLRVRMPAPRVVASPPSSLRVRLPPPRRCAAPAPSGRRRCFAMSPLCSLAIVAPSSCPWTGPSAVRPPPLPPVLGTTLATGHRSWPPPSV